MVRVLLDEDVGLTLVGLASDASRGSVGFGGGRVSNHRHGIWMSLRGFEQIVAFARV